jgi:hypothetical protein
MTGYRSHAMKPMAALWLLVVAVDAGWAATSSTGALLALGVSLVIAALIVIAIRSIRGHQHPVATAGRVPARVPVRTVRR